MEKQPRFMSIGDAAERIGVSIDTLRRWDASGRLRAARRTPGRQRLYSQAQIDLLAEDRVRLGFDWARDGIDIPSQNYCERSVTFQARLDKFKNQLFAIPELLEVAPLIVAVCGEIGDNSFVHNIGNWPDKPGIYFAYDLNRRFTVLADRGRGVLATLRPVKPSLRTDAEALTTAFMEVISGRAPEKRGNGLKFVRTIASTYPIKVSFQSGTSRVLLDREHPTVAPLSAEVPIRGCFAVIKF